MRNEKKKKRKRLSAKRPPDATMMRLHRHAIKETPSPSVCGMNATKKRERESRQRNQLGNDFERTSQLEHVLDAHVHRVFILFLDIIRIIPVLVMVDQI
jgi:hypothetical protein